MGEMQGTASVSVGSSATAVYDLVADVTRMGEWSPECVRCEWLDEPGKVGSRFRGHNRRGLLRWKTVARVVVAEPGQAFAFTTMQGERESSRWRYEFRPSDSGTEVIETFEVVYEPAPLRFIERIIMPNREQELVAGMQATLERIRAVAEAGS